MTYRTGVTWCDACLPDHPQSCPGDRL